MGRGQKQRRGEGDVGGEGAAAGERRRMWVGRRRHTLGERGGGGRGRGEVAGGERAAAGESARKGGTTRGLYVSAATERVESSLEINPTDYCAFESSRINQRKSFLTLHSIDHTVNLNSITTVRAVPHRPPPPPPPPHLILLNLLRSSEGSTSRW